MKKDFSANYSKREENNNGITVHALFRGTGGAG